MECHGAALARADDRPGRPAHRQDGAVLLIDAANVVGSVPDGWWRDRPGAARRLVDRVRRATDEGRLTPPVVVVLEGAARRGVEPAESGGVTVLHAPGSGDDLLAAVALETLEGAGAVRLVTADRGLRSRVEQEGAELVGPRWLLEQLEG